MNDSPELGPGIRFFDWVRKMTVDACYTSEIGIKDLDHRGNAALEKFEVPEEAIRHVFGRQCGLVPSSRRSGRTALRRDLDIAPTFW